MIVYRIIKRYRRARKAAGSEENVMLHWRKRLLAACLTFVMVFLCAGSASALPPESETLRITGAPPRLTAGAALPAPLPLLRAEGGAIPQALGLTPGAFWLSSADGKTFSKPLPEDAVVEAGNYYYLCILATPPEGGAFASSLRATVNGAPAPVQHLGGAVFLAVRYDRRTLQLSHQEGEPLYFEDVPTRAWYYEDVTMATRLGLLNGTGADTFTPEGDTTRAMLLTILYRMEGQPEAAATAGFPDVRAGSWYAPAVAWGAAHGIIEGFEDGTFHPDDCVTREQVAVILCRYAGYCGYDITPWALLENFDDTALVSEWALNGMRWAVTQSLIGGSSERGGLYLNPQGNATRAQIAAIICRFHRSFMEEEIQLPEFFSLRGYTIGYIPLDNRPVNARRPVYLAESAGLCLRMPDASLFATRMDGQTPNANGTAYGDREGLLAWLRENEDDCDAFVLSLDQLLSGGLVNSRMMDGEDLTFETEVIDYLAELSERKPVYLFDTVMRLTSTVGYLGLGNAEYSLFRTYGLVARKELSGEELTIDNIVAGYRFNEEGEEIPTQLAPELLERYLHARTRKLRLADAMLQKSGHLAAFLIGVDDSAPRASLQSNELAYLRERLGENCYLFCGTDELGMTAIARAYCDLLPQAMRLRVRYFGGEEDSYADAFDTGTLRESMEQHLLAMNCTLTKNESDADVLVLTRNYTQADYDAFMQAWQENERFGHRSIILDASGNAMSVDRMVNGIQTDYLLGYSCWGTVANTIGIGLSMGLMRWGWLQFEADGREEDTVSFAKGLVFAFVKDLAYCRRCRHTIHDLSPEGIEQALTEQVLTQRIVSKLSGQRLVSSLAGEHGQCYTLPTPVLSNFSAPLNRAYEIDFDIDLPETEA